MLHTKTAFFDKFTLKIFLNKIRTLIWTIRTTKNFKVKANKNVNIFEILKRLSLKCEREKRCDKKYDFVAFVFFSF